MNCTVALISFIIKNYIIYYTVGQFLQSQWYNDGDIININLGYINFTCEFFELYIYMYIIQCLHFNDFDIVTDFQWKSLTFDFIVLSTFSKMQGLWTLCNLQLE